MLLKFSILVRNSSCALLLKGKGEKKNRMENLPHLLVAKKGKS